MNTNASKFFNDTIDALKLKRSYGGKLPHTDPTKIEKFNLYTGLSTMAQQLHDIESILDIVQNDLKHLKTAIDQL